MTTPTLLQRVDKHHELLLHCSIMLTLASRLARRGPTWTRPAAHGARNLASYVDSVTSLIGATPMVRLHRVVGPDVDPSTKVLVKLEMQNPGGSVRFTCARRTLDPHLRVPEL